MPRKNAPPMDRDIGLAAGTKRRDLSSADVDSLARPGACTHFTLNAGTPFARPGGRMPARAARATSSEGVGAALRGEPPDPSSSRPRRSQPPGSGVGSLLSPAVADGVPSEPMVHFTLVDGIAMEKPKGGRNSARKPADTVNPLAGGQTDGRSGCGRRHFQQPERGSVFCTGAPDAPRGKAKSVIDMSTVIGSLLQDGTGADGVRVGEVRKHDYRIYLGRPGRPVSRQL